MSGKRRRGRTRLLDTLKSMERPTEIRWDSREQKTWRNATVNVVRGRTRQHKIRCPTMYYCGSKLLSHFIWPRTRNKQVKVSSSIGWHPVVSSGSLSALHKRNVGFPMSIYSQAIDESSPLNPALCNEDNFSPCVSQFLPFQLHFTSQVFPAGVQISPF